MIYLCTECKEEVQKVPLVSLGPSYRSATINDFNVGLGHWHCKCGNNKVQAVKGQSEKQANAKKTQAKRFKFKGKNKGQAARVPRPTNAGGSTQGSHSGLRTREAPRSAGDNPPSR